jgi:pyrroline-5-carboxylate reductase
LTFLSSAPAYFYYLIESMVSAAESHGLSPEIARSLVVQSCVGTGMLSRDSTKPIHTLRDEVCVPGGSTEKAIAHLANNHFLEMIRDAIGKSLQANREMKNVSRK